MAPGGSVSQGDNRCLYECVSSLYTTAGLKEGVRLFCVQPDDELSCRDGARDIFSTLSRSDFESALAIDLRFDEMVSGGAKPKACCSASGWILSPAPVNDVLRRLWWILIMNALDAALTLI